MAALMTVIMGFLPAVIFFLASLAAAFFSVWWAAAGYTIATYAVLVVIVVSCACVRPPPDPMNARRIILSDEEDKFFKKHYAFFRFPFGTQNFTHFLNFARMFGTVWLVVSLWQHFYWIAGALAACYLISGPVMMRLMPIAHYKAAAEKGHEFAVRKLAQIEHILQSRDSLEF
jgi:hypothetical protein